jgi:hypothetical protein
MNSRFTYNEPIRTEALAQATCDLMLSFGELGEEKKMSRPSSCHHKPCRRHQREAP